MTLRRIDEDLGSRCRCSLWPIHLGLPWSGLMATWDNVSRNASDQLEDFRRMSSMVVNGRLLTAWRRPDLGRSPAVRAPCLPCSARLPVTQGSPLPGCASPVKVEPPTRGTTLAGEAGSGGLWCVTGRARPCVRLCLPERPVQPEAGPPGGGSNGNSQGGPRGPL